MAVELSDFAEFDLIAIYHDGFRHFGEKQADRYQIGLEEAFERLGRTPRSGRAMPELGLDIRVSTYQAHAIVYRAKGDDVLILRVRSAREDWQSSAI